ncbi:helix-turn-helix domain-containing protein [Spirillospora sp. NBC_01491]|uniref:AraC-like ligand-binding domain-containing protein n=1 Tax=Spirillospora sp. NBC_01491 TaxID=2976007 RepID=UPI002E2EBF3F|nr:helix-turn-helix domain-containing protein [Spirillospora sp. NBC_01491]
MSGPTYAVEASSTDDVPARDRAEFWSEQTASYQSRMTCEYPRAGDFSGGSVRQRSRNHQLVRFWSGPVGYRRTARQIGRDADGDYRLLLPLAGGLAVRQGDREARLAPGSGALVPFGEPFEAVQAPGTRAFIMTIPAREVDGPLNRAAPLPAGLDFTTGLGRVAGAMLTGLHEERAALTGTGFDAVCDRLVELLCMLAAGDDRPSAPGRLAEVEALVRRQIRRRAADPGLNGAAVARELGWSLRQVQLALQQAGTTPRDLIRDERLKLVHDRLGSPRHRHLTISELAAASGFSSASALSTAFRRRYGVSPRDLRPEAVSRG